MSTYEFPPDLESAIREHMNSGRYTSADDVLREALEALRQREVEIAAIQEGIDDMEGGRVKSLSEFDREFRERKHI